MTKLTAQGYELLPPNRYVLEVTQAKPSGNVTWCIGKDTTGAFGTVVDNFNKANPDANAKPAVPLSRSAMQRSNAMRVGFWLRAYS